MECCTSRLCDFEFDRATIAHAAAENRLLTMEIEFSLRCNFRCPYCYVPEESYFDGELTPAEIRDVLLQAKALGTRRIIILGGEPSIYPHIREMIAFIQDQGMDVEMFTNGSGITADFARWLFDRHVRVVMKMNTFDADLQDRLSGKPGAGRIITKALEHLKQAGYPSEEAFLAASTIICRQNLEELPRLWCWLRDQGIAPYFEVITPQANALENPWLDVDPHTLQQAVRAAGSHRRGAIRPDLGHPAAPGGQPLPAPPVFLPGDFKGRRDALRGGDPLSGQRSGAIAEDDH